MLQYMYVFVVQKSSYSNAWILRTLAELKTTLPKKYFFFFADASSSNNNHTAVMDTRYTPRPHGK